MTREARLEQLIADLRQRAAANSAGRQFNKLAWKAVAYEQDRIADELTALLSETAATHSCTWKDAIIDACVVDWIFTKDHETDPRKAVNDLLCWQQRIALDPAVSEDAAKLHARIAELEAAS